MSMTCEVMKVQASDKSQGDFVEINVEDFDKDVHKKYVEPRSKPAARKDTTRKSEG